MKELIDIQKRLKAPKGQLNKFGGYNYRSCEDILTAVKPLLAELECYVTLYDEVVSTGSEVQRTVDRNLDKGGQLLHADVVHSRTTAFNVAGNRRVWARRFEEFEPALTYRQERNPDTLGFNDLFTFNFEA